MDQTAYFAHAKNLVRVHVGRAGIPHFELSLIETGEPKKVTIHIHQYQDQIA